jgi:hypothetical protein
MPEKFYSASSPDIKHIIEKRIDKHSINEPKIVEQKKYRGRTPVFFLVIC